MVKKFNEFINETIFGDMIKRSYKKDVLKKEDEAQIKELINRFINRRNPDDYYIEDGLVCCKGNVVIEDTDLVDGHFPVKFGKVDGYFDCYICHSLTSLKGSPKKVGDYFSCYNCDSLTSLEGAPEEVGDYFDCSFCHSLTSLEGSPKKVGDYFSCSNCGSLTSLEGSPEKVGGNFYCSDCKKKFSISDLPKDTIINGEFLC